MLLTHQQNQKEAKTPHHYYKREEGNKAAQRMIIKLAFI